MWPGVVEADEQLAGEQERLEETYAAFDGALRRLVGRNTRELGVDEFADEALERMRRERIRVYTQASGPLYFGRIDPEGRDPLYIGRHVVVDGHNRVLVGNWRAPAAEPFYAATAHDPRGLRLRRRLDIEDRRVLGFVDEALTGTDSDHLTEAIVEDITRRRVGEMRQIIATITPEQYGMIREDPTPALVIQGGPGTGKTAVGLHRAAWLLYANPALGREGVLIVGPNRTFIRYIGQVLPSLGEQSVEQREIDALVSRPRQEISESSELATLKGSGRMAALLERLLWSRIRAPEGDVIVRIGSGRAHLGADEVMALHAAARDRTRSYQGARMRFRETLADQLVSAPAARRSAARRCPTRTSSPPCVRAGVPEAGRPGVAAGRRRNSCSPTSSRTAAGCATSAGACSPTRRSTLLLSVEPPTGARGEMTPQRRSRCSTRRAGSSTPRCGRSATSSSTRRRTSRRWSCGWSSAARAASR